MLPQTLLIDADDTLWENNVYFDQAIAGESTGEKMNYCALSRALSPVPLSADGACGCRAIAAIPRS